MFDERKWRAIADSVAMPAFAFAVPWIMLGEQRRMGVKTGASDCEEKLQRHPEAMKEAENEGDRFEKAEATEGA